MKRLGRAAVRSRHHPRDVPAATTATSLAGTPNTLRGTLLTLNVGMFGGKADELSDEFQSKDTARQRPLVCPSCHHHFAYRDFHRIRACPSCQVSLGFSVLYRNGLAIFAIAVFLYCSYKAVLSVSVVLSVAGLILAAPLALIARLFFISNVPPRLHSLGLAKCPICDGALNRAAVRPGPFDCPHCLKQIRPIHRPIYRWARGGLCFALAIVAAKLKGFDWSFLIFVVSAYALPAFFFWDVLAVDLSPPTRFEPTHSPVQVLGIGKS
jgi:hypothetical protein